MPKPPSEPRDPSGGQRPALRRLLDRAAHPLIVSALAVSVVLIAIATDVAARAGWVPFLLLCYAHVRTARRKVAP